MPTTYKTKTYSASLISEDTVVIRGLHAYRICGGCSTTRELDWQKSERADIADALGVSVYDIFYWAAQA